MSVLPPSATFPSFFVVLAIFFFITLFLGVNLSKLRETIRPALQNSKSRLDLFSKPLVWTKGYIQGYVDTLTPSNDLRLDYRPSSRDLAKGKRPYLLHRLYYFIRYNTFFRNTFTVLMHDCLIPEILFPWALWNRYLYRNNPFVQTWWSPFLFVAHVIRLAFIPAWAALVIVMICYFVFLDFSSACFHLVRRLFGYGE